jgi:hypothetical protein
LQAVDASSIIYAWENYPITHFASLWGWISGEIQAQRLVIPALALEETVNVEPACGAWLITEQIHVLPVDNAAVVEASRIKALLGIVGDDYRSGVGENDLIIIASAKHTGRELISNESVQAVLPRVMANYKIPAVCALATVGVQCCPFLTYFKRTQQQFG